MTLHDLITFLAPPQGVTSHSEKIISATGGFLSIFLTMFISGHYLGFHDAVLIGGAMGASVVLLFAVPHSPLAQPWAFIGGHLVSTVVAVTVYNFVPNLYAAAGLAVGGAILFMAYLRCLHPPGGGTALAIIISGPATHALGYQYAITPIAYNLILMLAVALLFNNIATRRWYPLSLHQLWSPPAAIPAAKDTGRSGLAHEDIAAALKEMNAVIDVTEEDLDQIYSLASVHAHMRRVRGVMARDIMTRDTVTVAPDADLLGVWYLMQQHTIKGVPVVDSGNRVLGIITISDFLKQAGEHCKRGFPQCLLDMFRNNSGPAGLTLPRMARDIMSTQVVSVSEDADVIHLLPIFARKKIHHLPVLDADKKLLGMITLPSLMAVLHDDAAADKS